jgi:phosphoribosyl-ATP pyrophosphohydrolase/phosphoribosyl-AMP cyclohydrolase
MSMAVDFDKIDFSKCQGLIPVCVQNYNTLQVLMIGFMNEEALQQTVKTGLVTFYSRSKQRLWTKGESSGNYLNVEHIILDCDEDSLLIYAQPQGPTCHTGRESCFNHLDILPPLYWLGYLQEVIRRRIDKSDTGYTNSLISSGIKRIAQKVGEEGVEVALAALSENAEELSQETVDLLYHLFVLLRAKNISFKTISDVIRSRSKHETSVSIHL